MTDTRPTGAPVYDEHLAALPLDTRRTIAEWLLQRADSMVASWVLSDGEAAAIKDTLYGAAVDLVDPLSEDTTIGHAAHVLGTLGR